MKRIALVLMFLAALATGNAHVRDVAPEQTRREGSVVRVDTIVKEDTLIRTEIITRTDIISRREVVVRKDSLVSSLPASLFDSGFPEDADMDVTQSPGNVAHLSEPDVTEAPAVVRSEIPYTLPAGDGGTYVWVPDSMSRSVARLLDGESAASVFPETTVSADKVTFRGDTVPLVLRDRNFGRFNRGLFNHLFIPKGIWQIGVTASYGEFSTSDLEIFDLVSDIDFSGHMFSVRPYFSYFIGNNMSVGMRLGYTSGKADIGSFNVDIDEDMGFNLKDIMYRSESYTAALTFNQYFGMAARGRFGIFNEVELAFSSGSYDFNRPYNGVPKLTHTTTMQAALNFSPGVCVFIMDQVSFNVSFGVFGFTLKNEKQTVDGEKMGNRFTSGANFRFNIFNINFGVAVNL